MRARKNKRLFPVLCLLTGLIFLLSAISLSIAYSFTAGNLIALLAGVLLIILYKVYPRLSRRKKILLKSLLLLWVTFMTILSVFIARNGSKNTATFDEDCVLALGCGIRGETPLPTLRMRLDKCLEYLQHNPNAWILVSGGQGRNETIAEAEAMERYLVSKGVDPSQILQEDQSSNTAENMQFSKPILDQHFASKTYKVVCITSDYHAYRAQVLSEKYGIPVSHYNAPTPWHLYPSAYLREALSICKMWIMDRCF